MERKHEPNPFLVGNGADEFLAARSRQTKNIIHTMVHRDVEIGLRDGVLLTVSSHILFSSMRAFSVSLNLIVEGPNRGWFQPFQYFSELQNEK
jgi:hypothetical protein